jgi:hypothetical protein
VRSNAADGSRNSAARRSANGPRTRWRSSETPPRNPRRQDGFRSASSPVRRSVDHPRDQLAARIALALQPVGVHEIRGDIVGIVDQRALELEVARHYRLSDGIACAG